MQTMSQPQPASAGIPNPHSTNFSTGVASRYTASSGFSASDKVLQVRNTFSGYNGAQPRIPGLTSIASSPVCPNVKLRKLPFYDILYDIIKPTNLQPQGSARLQEATFPFNLETSQSADVASSKEIVYGANGEAKIQYGCQLQLRFCLSDPSNDQEDSFPPSLQVKLNGKMIPLPHPIPSNRPGVEPKRPSRPLNVTNYAKLSPHCTNNFTVVWSAEGNKTYTISLYLVKKLCSSDLLTRLQGWGVRSADFTRKMIRDIVEKDEADCQIATTSFKVSIACPLGKRRMTLPCRSKTCQHLQCFDANLYLQMNEKKPSWNCPVCDKAILFDNLAIDGYFQEVLNKMESTPPSDGNDIEVLPDGTWMPIKPKKNDDSSSPPVKRIRKEAPSHNQTICIDDDLIIEDDLPPPSKRKSETITLDVADNDSDSPVEELSKTNQSSSSSNKRQNKQVEVECITIDSSDDEEEEAEPEPEEPSSPPPGPTRTLRPRGGKATYVDETSSSSSTTNDDSIKMDPSSDHGPASPACITLGSPSPSPELRQEPPVNSKEGSSSSSGPNFSNFGSFAESGGIPGSGLNFSTSSSVAYNTRQAAQASNAPAVSAAGYSSLSNDSSSSLLSSSTYATQPSPGYVHYSSNWNAQPQQGTYPGGTNFGPLDYQSMDYFSQPSYNTRSGAGGGYNWPT